MKRFLLYFLCVTFVVVSSSAFAAEVKKTPRDQFFWLGQINKASLVVNTEEGLIDPSVAPRFAKGIAKVLEDGSQPGGSRPRTVITFEPLLIKAAGDEITMLHAGRSSQDMHAAYRMAMAREELLALAESLAAVNDTIIKLAEKHRDTIVPSYTNGVAAQPTSYGHYLLAFADGFARDMQRLHQYYSRLDRSPMGSTVLNGTSWPLNRDKMAAYLGFASLAYNAYDANQIFTIEYAPEAGFVATEIALHVGSFIEDIMQQYAQPRPWILLQEGGENTYVSSAMPQKRNPGLLNSTRVDASTIIGQAMGCIVRSHNVPPGMGDGRSNEMSVMLKTTAKMLNNFNKILKAMVVSKERALEELNLDWTASQEVADELMRKYKLPFRVGHHFASEMVGYAKTKNILPLQFPYAEAKRIYKEAMTGHTGPAEFPMSEAEFKATLDPVAIVKARATKGGPQPVEMTYMLEEAKKTFADQQKWIKDSYATLSDAEKKLNSDFEKLLKQQ